MNVTSSAAGDGSGSGSGSGSGNGNGSGNTGNGGGSGSASESSEADDSSSSNSNNSSSSSRPEVVVIAPHGDVVLDVLFETSAATLRTARKAAAAAAAAKSRRPALSGPSSSSGPPPDPPILQPRFRVAFRADAAVLKKHSRYFANLLGDTRFGEARAVEAALAALAADHVRPADADAARLPWVRIEDDDEGSRTAGREIIFGELLRILHGSETAAAAAAAAATAAKTTPVQAVPQTNRQTVRPTAKKSLKTSQPKSPLPVRPQHKPPLSSSQPRPPPSASQPQPPPPPTPTSAPPPDPLSRWSAKTPPTLLEMATLALLADRLACTAPVGAYLRTLRVRMPQPVVRSAVGSNGNSGGGGGGDDSGLPTLANEEAVRQNIFVAWLLDQPMRFQRGTRDLIIYGSRRWSEEEDEDEDDDDGYDDEDGYEDGTSLPAWWDLPDDLEQELRFRRACIVDCIASIPRHFLRLYTARSDRRQCLMGYGSSTACDSFQLGEMVKFLCHKDLLTLEVFGGGGGGSSRRQRGHHRGHGGHRGHKGHRHGPPPPVDVHCFLAALKQCPAYQLDRDHVNCGLRARLLPVVAFMEAMLAASAIALRRRDWAAPGRNGTSWVGGDDGDDDGDGDSASEDGVDGVDFDGGGTTRHPFGLTRAIARDQRLRVEGSMTADRMARRVFTARRWNWTPE